ncbi:hypothetical protein [Pseudomonas spirodelae]|uniref:Uncharacterized protein n=1 Tax=Pseudomonas spirodelae TaxID=3101751 RepID=A0ABU5P7C5_9PSED|nr:hypothetical protein [Pseudomonas sp. T5W1]MEA1605571.1 hypothetical protein [Pseudomonas sp. T5W1]
MQIKPIADLLRNNNLRYPTLAVLQPTNSPYTALLVQPEALVKVRDNYIRNANQDRARKLFTSIAQEASERSVELLVTPEYSFPWESIEELLQMGVSPTGGQLWVLGCESLALSDLDDLKGRFGQWAEVLHEPLPPHAATARYLDPLVYIFSTEQIGSGAPRTVMVVQFKTTPSGDPDNIEATRMARGDDIYIFENGNEIRLISLICSDAFAFTDEMVDASYEGLLLLHLQLNDRPRHETYMRYRRRLYEFDCDRTELICLNWAENITFDLQDGRAPFKKTNISASAWHSKSLKFATDDARVERNHRQGLYYTRDSEQHRHMLHFSYEPAAFLLEATKVRHHAVPAALSRRLGPELIHVLHWSEANQKWAEATDIAGDGFEAMIEDYSPRVQFLTDFHATSPLAIERLSCVTSGELGPSPSWFAAPNLPTVALEPRTEVVRRLSVAHDPDGKAFREQRVRTIDALAGIPAADLPLPSHMADLHSGYRFTWSVESPNCNVVSIHDNKVATLVYAGESPAKSHLSGLFARVRATISKTSFADRLCVLYRDGPELKRFDPPVDRLITQTNTNPGKSFLEPEK